MSDDEKKLKQAIKKRDQIRALVEKQKRGEKLEINQVNFGFSNATKSV
jgi:uncharacterized protein with WD repeat